MRPIARSWRPRPLRGEREAFERDFLAAIRLEAEDPAASILRHRELLKRQPGFAECHYRLARLLERFGSAGEAYDHYVAARDNDGYPMRCLTPFQDAYREVAKRHRCVLIDAQAYLHKIGRRGRLDDELFEDMMHPSLKGYIALAQAVLCGLKSRGALGWPPAVPLRRIDPGCLRRPLRAWQRDLETPLQVASRFQRAGAPLAARSQRSAAKEAGGRGGIGATSQRGWRRRPRLAQCGHTRCRAHRRRPRGRSQ